MRFGGGLGGFGWGYGGGMEVVTQNRFQALGKEEEEDIPELEFSDDEGDERIDMGNILGMGEEYAHIIENTNWKDPQQEWPEGWKIKKGKKH